jgi:NADPH-dependent glutamate synthase beta subunit-like oxidoreductase
VKREELERGRGASSVQEIEEHRAKKRMDELLLKAADAPPGGKSKALALRFLLAPSRVVEDPARPGHVGGLECDVTQLEGPANAQRAVPSGRKEVVPAGLVLRSIGYKSVAVPGVPFDDKRAVVRNTAGRVHEADGTPVPGLYVSGWLKRGPSGIIGTNIPDARETVGVIVADKGAGKLPGGDTPGLDAVKALLTARGRDPATLVSWDGYRAIDAHEVATGSAAGKPREKLTHVDAMLATARKAAA